MVLSNKKLKQRLRQELAESLASSAVVAVPNAPNGDPNLQTQSLKDLLDSVAQKPRLSKREKRRKTLPLKGLNSSNAQEEVADKEDSKVNEESKEVSLVGTTTEEIDVEADGKKKKKKRKRDAVVAKEASVADGGEEGVVKEAKESKKKNKKKKKKGNKNKKQKTKTNNPEEKVGEQEQGVTETNEDMDSQAEVVIPTKIYVGGIPFYYNEDDIRNYFRTCGKITEVDCKMRPEDGEFTGIAFITFETEDSATRAMELDRAAMGERFLTIQPYKKVEVKKVSDFAPEMVKGYNRIYCGNLAWDITEKDLKEFFSDCNTSFIRLGTDKETKEFKGYAHINFKDSVSMAMALKLDQGIVCGRPIRISCAVSNKGGQINYKPVSTTNIDSNNGSSKSVVTTETDNDISRASNGTSKPVVTTETDKYISKSAPPGGEEPYYGGEEAYYGGEEQYYGGEEEYYGGEEAYYGGASTEVDNVSSVAADNGGSAKVSGKIRRRTCYECGQKGHLFSDCPKKQAAEAEPTN